MYTSATWDLAWRLTRRAWAVDGLNVILRPDSEGGFIAWDQPWSNRSDTAHSSLARGRMVMKTMPNITDPLILLSVSASRIKSGMAFARTVLTEQGDPDNVVIDPIGPYPAGRGRALRNPRAPLKQTTRRDQREDLHYRDPSYQVPVVKPAD